MDIKRRKKFIVIKRKRRRNVVNGNKRSPCYGCSEEGESKNTQWCLECKAPGRYADRIEAAAPHCPAIDYSRCYSLDSVDMRFLSEVIL